MINLILRLRKTEDRPVRMGLWSLAGPAGAKPDLEMQHVICIASHDRPPSLSSCSLGPEVVHCAQSTGESIELFRRFSPWSGAGRASLLFFLDLSDPHSGPCVSSEADPFARAVC